MEINTRIQDRIQDRTAITVQVSVKYWADYHNAAMNQRSRRSRQVFIVTFAGLSALALGAVVMLGGASRLTTNNTIVVQSPSSQLDSTLAALVSLSAEQRLAQLEAIARQPESAEQYRARYLLATDFIQQGQGDAAIAQLADLETKYPLMAPYILRQRARAYEVSRDLNKAQDTWQDLVQRYPDDPVSAEALVVLGYTNARRWQEAIARFPSHPRTLDAIRVLLQRNPNQPELLLLLTRHGFYSPGIVSVADKLTGMQKRIKLKPEDWEAIAFTYWENQVYGKAGHAYAKAPRTAQNAYRAARGLQLNDEVTKAIQAYQALAREFPTSPETATGLLRLARLQRRSPNTAIPYLDAIVTRFPNRAAEALQLKAEILDLAGSSKAAMQTRQRILDQYRASSAAAEIRWQQASSLAKAGNLKAAITWVEPIAIDSPTSDIAPKATYWAGKWASRLGDEQQAKKLFTQVLSQYPESYFAWRSASMLGYDVGGFSSVRRLAPQVVRTVERSPLPSGSPILQELYQLGQSWDAWSRWRVEFQAPQTPTVAQQFTDGVLRFGVGDHLDGIYMVSSLSDRTTDQEKAEYQALRRQPAYWQALYPFPYMNLIEAWSQQRQLNPLLVIALMRQESRFEPAIKSVSGATGLMQVMPDTGAWIAEKTGLRQPYRLDNPEDNVMMGTWYLDYTHQEYGDNSMLAIASYNAGPGSVADWLDRFGLADPDDFVANIPFDETRGYVEAVFENYWNYLRLYNPEMGEIMTRY